MSMKHVKITAIDKMQLKIDCIDGSNVKSITFSNKMAVY